MCLIAFAWQVHSRYPLLIAANRDEFHARPAAPAQHWPDRPGVYGGRDLLQMGAWLALAARGRLAAVTNVRRMVPPNPQARSRGELVVDFVTGRATAADYAAALRPRAAAFGGFNLLLWDGAALRFCTNQPAFAEAAISPGVHVLSNASLDTPWPKSRRLHAAMARQADRARPDVEALFTALRDERAAPDAELPDTGIGLERERWLSAPFIRGPDYGTRASSVVLVDDGGARFIERRFGPDGRADGAGEDTVPFAPEG